jgi:hypothetical protein
MKAKWMLIAFSVFFLAGCLELEERITINRDGSGYYEQRLTLSKEFSSIIQRKSQNARQSFKFPVNEQQLRNQFLGEGIKITKASFGMEDGQWVSNFRIEFKDAAKFFQLPHVAKRFIFYKEDGNLIFMSLLNPPNGRPPENPGSSDGTQKATFQFSQETQGLMKEEFLKSMGKLLKGFKVSFKITLPNKIISTNAMRSSGRSATWIIDERAIRQKERLFSDEEFFWALCSVDGLKFTPPDESKIQRFFVHEPPEGAVKEAVSSANREGSPHPRRSPQKSLDLQRGGRCEIILKNGNRFNADSYSRNGEMLSVRRFGGTYSIPISSVKEIVPLSSE